jgi:hypothetical protein
MRARVLWFMFMTKQRFLSKTTLVRVEDGKGIE